MMHYFGITRVGGSKTTLQHSSPLKGSERSGHKYIDRKMGKNGKWQYIYDTPGGGARIKKSNDNSSSDNNGDSFTPKNAGSWKPRTDKANVTYSNINGTPSYSIDMPYEFKDEEIIVNASMNVGGDKINNLTYYKKNPETGKYDKIDANTLYKRFGAENMSTITNNAYGMLKTKANK